MRIELTYPAWKAGVLPLNYARRNNLSIAQESMDLPYSSPEPEKMGSGGFEPPKV